MVAEIVQVALDAELDAARVMGRGEVEAVVLVVAEAEIGMGAGGEVVQAGGGREVDAALELGAADGEAAWLPRP